MVISDCSCAVAAGGYLEPVLAEHAAIVDAEERDAARAAEALGERSAPIRLLAPTRGFPQPRSGPAPMPERGGLPIRDG